MKKILLLLFIFPTYLFAQDSVFHWNVTSKSTGKNEYEIIFSTKGNTKWQLYAPNQKLSDVATTELQFNDSAITHNATFGLSGNEKKEQNNLFNTVVNFFDGETIWTKKISINGDVPATLQGTLLYTYGKGDEFYPATPFTFSVPLEGGVQASTNIKLSRKK